MKIIDVEAIVVGEPLERVAIHSWDGSQDAVILRVITDEGIVGIGEADSSPDVVRAIVETTPTMRSMWGLRDLAVGEDPRAIGRLREKLYQGTAYYGRAGAVMHAIAGVELACWDILGKATGLPLSMLLGGAHRQQLPVYASLITPDTPEETADAVRVLVDQGYQAIKLGGGPLGQDVAHDEAIANAARKAAPTAHLMIDYGQLWDSVDRALRACRALERYAIRWIEEPLQPEEISAYAWLTARSPVPIAAGEAEDSEGRLLEMVEQRAVSVLQPDITRAGLSVVRRVAEAARRHRMDMVLHTWSTGIIKAASIHLTASQPHMGLLEYCVAENPIQASMTRQQFPLRDGMVAVPDEPGLGIDLNDDLVSEYTRPREKSVMIAD